jgi:hypothetical protein
MKVLNYNGLRRKPKYNEIIEQLEEQNEKGIFKYPDRTATNIFNSNEFKEVYEFII